MIREILYDKICPYSVDCENTNCDTCHEMLDRWFDKYDEQIRAEAIKEIQELMKQYVNYENVDIFIEALGQLEKQNKSKNLKF